MRQCTLFRIVSNNFNHTFPLHKFLITIASLYRTKFVFWYRVPAFTWPRHDLLLPPHTFPYSTGTNLVFSSQQHGIHLSSEVVDLNHNPSAWIIRGKMWIKSTPRKSSTRAFTVLYFAITNSFPEKSDYDLAFTTTYFTWRRGVWRTQSSSTGVLFATSFKQFKACGH